MIPVMVSAQNFKSPSEFLNYPLGSKFTPHFKIVDYFKYAATANPSKLQLQQYGETYEGRPLLLAVVSSQENMANIDEIRKNNLRLTGLLKDKPGNADGPAIVWLSYNVHGNEASSSEVAMKMLYTLLSDIDKRTSTWLKNTIIIIDPCLNPDGRDRYVNWYNGIVGKNANADVQAAEHNEPWPRGRTNHYYFDLNRDWAWQSQIETKGRIEMYNQWMPEIHVDFHEQYYFNPYYFAPAAEPIHEGITPFQRSFQVEIGKNHAKYFDAQGWLYFTKEYFDLFYPSYGDTYPIFNGAIGMTYEQAGHSMAGLAISTGADTLKLTDRIEHHFVTGMSTIEVASLNSSRLIKEFKKYFDDSYNSGNGIYKTYILRGDNESKINTLTELLKRNNIQYSKVGRSSQLKGFDYFSNTNTNFSTNENDLLISSFQPKSELVRVLFEPQSKLSDSATYDITAWSLPYAFGIQAYALKEKLSGVPFETANKQYQMLPDSYGYLIEYNSFTGGKVLASLLKNNFNVRISNNPFSIGGKDYKNGTLIILKSSNKDKIEELSKIAFNLNAVVTPITSGFMEKGFDFGSDKIKLLKKPNVAMILSNTAEDTKVGEVWHLFDQQLNYPLTVINSEMNNIDYSKYDVIILPSGYYKSLSDKNENADLKSWLNKGGRLIAMEYAVKQLADGEWGIKIKKDDDEDSSSTDTYADLKKYGDRERDGLEDFTPGSIFKLELDNTHPLAYGYPDFYYTLKQNTTMYSFLKGGWNVGVIKKNSKVAGFVGARLSKKLVDATIFGVQPYGRGSIIYMAEDPLFRSFWENGKLLFTNAVFVTGE